MQNSSSNSNIYYTKMTLANFNDLCKIIHSLNDKIIKIYVFNDTTNRPDKEEKQNYTYDIYHELNNIKVRSQQFQHPVNKILFLFSNEFQKIRYLLDDFEDSDIIEVTLSTIRVNLGKLMNTINSLKKNCELQYVGIFNGVKNKVNNEIISAIENYVLRFDIDKPFKLEVMDKLYKDLEKIDSYATTPDTGDHLAYRYLLAELKDVITKAEIFTELFPFDINSIPSNDAFEAKDSLILSLDRLKEKVNRIIHL